VKLSTRSLYGLRLLYQVARNYEKGPLQLKEVATRESISEKYLGQIVLLLRSSGILVSVRGSQGGYLLARKPSSITVLQVVEVLEGDFFERLEDDSPVTDPSQAATREVWRRLGQSVRDVLGAVTLAELLNLPQNGAEFLDFAI